MIHGRFTVGSSSPNDDVILMQLETEAENPKNKILLKKFVAFQHELSMFNATLNATKYTRFQVYVYPVERR